MSGAEFTVASRGPAGKRGFSRTFVAVWVRCLAAGLLGWLLAGVAPAHAQIACPVQLLQGDGQQLTPGVPSAPLVFRQTGAFASAPPMGNVQFSLLITGDAIFAASGSRTLVTSAPWTPLSGSTFAATVSDVRVVAGDEGGSIVVSVQSMPCALQEAPGGSFFLFGLPIDPPRILAISGNGAVVQAGQTLELVAELESRGEERSDEGMDFVVVSGDGVFLPNGTQSTNSPIDFSTGRSSATLRVGAREGGVIVEARLPGFQSTTFNVEVQTRRTVAVVAGDAQSGPPAAAGQPLVLEVRDMRGLPVAGVTVSWGVGFGVGPRLASETTVTGADGRTSNTFVHGPTAGESVIVASLPGGEAARFRVIAALGGGGLEISSGDNQTGAAGSEADLPIVFSATNSAGRPANGETVQFAVVAGNATLINSSDVVGANGTASVRFRYGPSPGMVRIRAALAGGQFSATATATSFAAGAAAAGGNNQTATAGSRLPQPLVVQLAQPPEGAKGLGGVPITWTVTAGGGRLDSATTVTDAAGRASNQFTLGPAPGANTVRADLPGGGSIGFSATATSVVPSGASFQIASGNDQALATGAPSAPLVVRLRTPAGAPIPGATIAWRVTPVANGSASPASSVTNAQGEASTTVTLGIPGVANVSASIPDSPAVPPLSFSLNGGVSNIGGLDEGQIAVAEAIDAACPALARQAQTGALTAGQRDLLARCSELVGNAGGNPADVERALSQMLNDEAAAQDDAAFNTTAAQFDNLKARIAALRSGAAGNSLGGLAIAGGSGVLPLSFLPSTLVAGDGGGAAGDEVGADFSRWGFFASGTIGTGDRDAKGGSPGYSFDTWGLTAGVDYRWSDRLVFGAALGYNSNDTDVAFDQGSLETAGYSGSLYTTWYQGDAWFADAVLTYGRNSYELSRRIRYQLRGAGGAMQSVDQIATASPDGDQTQFAISAGRDFSVGAWSVGPYARATLTQVDFEAYSERMSNPSAPGGGLAMAVEARELKSMEAVVGGKVSYTLSTSWGVLVPHAQIEFLHEFEDTPDDIVARFANDPTGTAILVPQSAVDTDYLNLGIGLSGVFADGRSAFVYYERRAGQSGYSQDNLALGLRIEF